jgi:hypothetical protein
MDHSNITDSKILRDIIITELEKYHKLLLEQGLEEQERVHELIGMLKEENRKANGNRTKNP